MRFSAIRHSHLPTVIAGLVLMITALVWSGPLAAQVTAFKQAVAETAAQDEDIAVFYREAGYAPIWTGPEDIHRARRSELLRAITGAEAHGLPTSRYDPDGVLAMLRSSNFWILPVDVFGSS